ncbi:GIY-YIG nuclease family protein [Spongiibacter marinus]|uniref:GIY-YIG nuclease family protein n=1 Tax=Spongiibacter marinus TaxID=354246 RepID=UPI0035BE1E75
MSIPSKVRFELVNGLTEREVKSAAYFIYAHKCTAGTYVGMSQDPVKRWQEHVSDAFNSHSHNADDKFREAIRGFRDTFKHYILAIATFEKAARNKEAAAIEFYSENLNMKAEAVSHRDYGFKSIDSQISLPIVLEKKGKSGTSFSRQDSERIAVVAEVFEEFGRKRLKCIGGQPFEKGLLIECSREERAKLQVGDRVKVKVQISEKRGKKYLVAARSATLTKVEKS